jgi:hypothetical protein
MVFTCVECLKLLEALVAQLDDEEVRNMGQFWKALPASPKIVLGTACSGSGAAELALEAIAASLTDRLGDEVKAWARLDSKIIST